MESDPNRGDVLVHVVNGAVVRYFGSWNHNRNPHLAKCELHLIANGDPVVFPLRLLRPAMPGEARRAYRTGRVKRVTP